MPYGNRYGGGGYAGVGSVGGEGGGLLGGFSNGLAQGLQAAHNWKAEQDAQDQDAAKEAWDRDPKNPLNVFRLASAGLKWGLAGDLIPLNEKEPGKLNIPAPVLAAMGGSTGASAPATPGLSPAEIPQPPDSEALPKVGLAEQGASAGQTPPAEITPPAAAIAPPAAKAAPVEAPKPTLDKFTFREPLATETRPEYNRAAREAEMEWQRQHGRMAIQKTKDESNFKKAAATAAQGQQLRGMTAVLTFLDKQGVTRVEPLVSAQNRLMEAYYASKRGDDSALMKIAQEKGAGNADVSALLQTHQAGQPLGDSDRAAMFESVRNTLGEEMNRMVSGSQAATTPEMLRNWQKSFPHWATAQPVAAQFFRDMQNLVVKPKLEAVLRTLTNTRSQGKFASPIFEESFNNYQALHKQLFGKEWKAEDLRMANPETGQVPGEQPTPVPPPAGGKDYSHMF